MSYKAYILMLFVFFNNHSFCQIKETETELKSLFRKEHKSKGMELLSKRFKLLAKEYGSDIETGITDVMNNGEITGTLVTIKVPLKFSEQNKK